MLYALDEKDHCEMYVGELEKEVIPSRRLYALYCTPVHLPVTQIIKLLPDANVISTRANRYPPCEEPA